MRIFDNDAINRANLHSAVQALAAGAGGSFVFAFLLQAGLSVPQVLATLAAITASRFVLRPAVLPLATRLGLKRILILGTVGEAAVFPMVAHIHHVGPLLVVMVVVSSAASVLYWTSYHAYFAAMGDAEARGGQIGARDLMMAAAGVVAPALGGWALATRGPEATFWSVAVVQLLAAAPLVGAPDRRVAREAPGGFRAAAEGALLLGFDGWFGAGFYYVWQIALFVSLSRRFAEFGGALALAALAGAAASFGLGRLIDLGHGRRSTLAAYAAVSVVTVLKAGTVGSPALATFANVAGVVAAAAMIPALMTRVYNLAKASPCPLRFHIATEGGWDLGCGAGCLAAAAFAAARLPLGLAVLVGLPGAVLACWRLIAGYPSVAVPQ